MTTTLGKIPAKEDHETPSKRLTRDDGRRRDKTLVGAPARPLPRTSTGNHQAHANQVSTAVRIQLPTQPTGQAPVWRHVDLREDTTTAPPQLPACLHGTTGII